MGYPYIPCRLGAEIPPTQLLTDPTELSQLRAPCLALVIPCQPPLLSKAEFTLCL